MDCPLQLYKGKLKEALTLVPNISPERRSEAIRFWNDLAEQFQEIVTDSRSNNCNNSDVEDNGTNPIYQTLDCRDQTTIINATTSQGETSNNNVITDMSNTSDSAHTSSLSDADLKQANSQLSHYLHDDNIYKNLSESSYMTQTITSSQCLGSGKVNPVILSGKINPPVVDAVPTTAIPTTSYSIAEVECSSQSAVTNAAASCSLANSTSIQSNDPYGLLKQSGLINHTISSNNKPIVSVSSSLSGESYCNPIDLANSTNNAQTIGYITSANHSPVLTNNPIGKHDHDSSNDNNYDRILVAGTRANYSDEVGNGQFDRGPKMFHDIDDLNQFVQRVDSMDAIHSCSSAGLSSRTEHFTQSDKPLQQIQLFCSNTEYNHANNSYPTASKTVKDIYYSTICDDQATLAGVSDFHVQVQSVEKESLSSISSDSSGDSSSRQLAVKKEQVRDNLSADKQAPKNQHTCDICGKSGFSTKGNLKRHLRAHSGEKPFKCEFCDSSFTEKKSLKIHVRRHTGEKPYKCEICGKLFSQTGVLQSHMALHLNERKFDCQKCGKAFRQRSQLKLHLMRHDGVKRLECSTCNAKFLTKGDLERHCRIHTGERPYECKICGKTFTRQQSLNEHMNRHTGRKPYDCKFCDKTFSEMSACYKHAKTHTKQDQNQQQSRIQQRASNVNAS